MEIRYDPHTRALCQKDHRHSQNGQGSQKCQPDHVPTDPHPIPGRIELTTLSRAPATTNGSNLLLPIVEKLVLLRVVRSTVPTNCNTLDYPSIQAGTVK